MICTNSELSAAVRTRVIQALGEHTPEDEARIIVHVNGDCAVLHGCVHTWRQHERLGQVALETPGVASVDNQLALLIEPHLVNPPRAREVQPNAGN